MAGTGVDRTGRTSRREMILEAAAQLFFDRGFTGTGVDEIGAAVGVTGPAFYRHFPSKHDLLVALVERAVEKLQAVVDRALLEARDKPEDALRLIATFSAEACVDDGPLTAIYAQEARNLQPEARTRLNRLHRKMRNAWVTALRELRPELSDDEALFAIHAVGALQTSVATYHGTLDQDQQKQLLTKLTLAALHWS